MRPRPEGKPKSIRTYLAALALVAALPLALLQVRTGLDTYRLALAHGSLSAQSLAEATGAAALQFLSVSQGVLTGAAGELQGMLVDPASCQGALRALNGSIPFVVNLVVAGPDGTILCSAVPPPDDAVRSVAGRDWFQHVASTRDFSVGAPVIGSITGTWVMALAVPIVDAEGNFLGALGSSVPLNRFQEFLTGARLGPEDLITIADANRVVLARSRDPERWVGSLLPTEMNPENRVGPDRATTAGDDFEGIERFWAKLSLPSVGWTVFAGIPMDRIRPPARRAALQRALFSVLIVLLAALLAWLIQRWISGSVRTLVDSTRAAADGVPWSIPRRAPAEIRALAEHFSQTLDARNRAEAAERRAKDRYRSILDNAVFGIYLSTPDGRFLEVNPALASMLGYRDPEELLQGGVVGLYRCPEDRERFVRRYMETEVIDDLEVEWVRRDGTPITVRLNGKRIALSEGEVAFEVMAEDITAEKALEVELRHTQKMEAVGRLAGGVAHDFNNILTVIAGNTHLLLGEMPSDDPYRAEIAEISEAAARAEALTRQLLAFSRKEAPSARLVDINELLGGLERILARLMREDILVRTVLDTSVQPVFADPSQLEQVVMNLAVNARDAMPDGGILTMETRWSTSGPIWERRAIAGAGWVCLSVRDTGVGMDRATRDRIFEPFFTTKRKGEGTGLGLATVYAIVEAVGGHVSVDSTPGAGSRFDVWLPAAPSDVEASPHRDDDAEAPWVGAGTILVAEDEAPVRRIVQRVLEHAGYQVLLAGDGAEAIWISDHHEGSIDLVITDLVMPAVKGTEVAQHLERTREDTPVLFMSGYVDDLPVDHWIQGRPELFLPKPFTPSQLKSRVQALLRQRIQPGSAAMHRAI